MRQILDTDLIKIFDTGAEYSVLISMSQGGVIEHEPFEKSLHGLVGALTLATEVCAGKFFPKRLLVTNMQRITPSELKRLGVAKWDEDAKR